MAKSAERIDGVLSCDISFATGLMLVEYDTSKDPLDRVESVVRSSGLAIERLHTQAEEGKAASWWQLHRQSVTLLVALLMLVVGWALQVRDLADGAVIAWAVAIAAGGIIPARRAAIALRSRSLDMNVLMTTAVIGAMIIGEWSEGATVLVLFGVGNWLETRALVRTRRSIRELMALAPPVALVRRGEATVTVAPSDVRIGDTVIIRPGERIPLDGIVTSGVSAVDESPITGESVPADKVEGDQVFTGTLNAHGLLEIEVTSAADDSTLSRLIRLVEEAQGQRAPLQRLVDRFTRSYTPAVILLAAGVSVLPPLVGAYFGQDWGGLSDWFYRGLVLLVVGCPCALVISTPVAVVSAITRATRDGVLVKGGAFLEAAPKVRAVAFDKTGTLTVGRPEVADVVSLGNGGAEDVLEIAATLEAGSTHPLAQAVTRAAGSVRPRHLERFSEVAGKGIRAESDGVRYHIGSAAFVESEIGRLADEAVYEIERLEDAGRTVLVLANAERVIGLIGLADAIRPEARRTIASLKSMGITELVMLTGDNERTAAAAARDLGLSDYRARQLPEDKLESVRALSAKHGSVAMVGDGINDAAALALAEIGVSMGAAGSDTALETADVALLGDDLEALPAFLSLGGRTVAVIRQNVFFSIAVKLLVLVLAVFGYATLWMAVFADTGVSLLVVLNSLRLLRRGRERRG